MPAIEHPSHVGKYDIEEYLGGGMSRVYRARDRVLGRRVALKILSEEATADAESKARFFLEARTASSIRHENVVNVYDFGEDQGRPFMVMEFLEGQSLREAIRLDRLGDFTSRMKIALQVARAVEYIHASKIIHRDLKPENIHLGDDGKVTLMDFGIAKSEEVKLTRAGFTMGTPYYMAPEQVLGQPPTRQSDVYAFGMLLFELLTGAKPITGGTVEEIFHTILYDAPNLAPIEEQHFPPSVKDLIERCLAKQPAQRPQSLGAVSGEIERILNPPGSRPLTMKIQPYTRTGSAPVPRRQSRQPTGEQLPRFIEKLPASLRTETGLMLLAGLVAAVGITAIYLLIALARLA